MPYMDFWHVKDGWIKDNPVYVDFASVLLQLGRDVFAGEGWEACDSGQPLERGRTKPGSAPVVTRKRWAPSKPAKPGRNSLRRQY